MKKQALLLICSALALSVQALDLPVRQAGDTQYVVCAENRSGIAKDAVLRVRVVSPAMPSDEQVKAVAQHMIDTYHVGTYHNRTKTIFIYIADMPVNMAAYAAADGQDGRMDNYRLQKENYETWRIIKANQ
jgi:hypothetical protein